MLTMKTSVEEKFKKTELKKSEAKSEVTSLRCDVMKLRYRKRTLSVSVIIYGLLFAVMIMIMK